MNILDLTRELGLQPQRVAATGNGEYKVSCPNCKAGVDRFCIWPNEGNGGRYWCRVCDCKGDAIQFCRAFLGLSYAEACKKLCLVAQVRCRPRVYNQYRKASFSPNVARPVSED